jgi:hypothetical protein
MGLRGLFQGELYLHLYFATFASWRPSRPLRTIVRTCIVFTIKIVVLELSCNKQGEFVFGNCLIEIMIVQCEVAVGSVCHLHKRRASKASNAQCQSAFSLSVSGTCSWNWMPLLAGGEHAKREWNVVQGERVEMSPWWFREYHRFVCD